MGTRGRVPLRGKEPGPQFPSQEVFALYILEPGCRDRTQCLSLEGPEGPYFLSSPRPHLLCPYLQQVPRVELP